MVLIWNIALIIVLPSILLNLVDVPCEKEKILLLYFCAGKVVEQYEENIFDEIAVVILYGEKRDIDLSFFFV